MFKILCTVLPVCPIVLPTILGTSYNVLASELPIESKTESTKMVTLDEQGEDYNARTGVTSVLPQIDLYRR